MKKVLILAAAISITAGGAVMAAPDDTWFGSSHGVSNGNGHGHAYGWSNRGDRSERRSHRRVVACSFSCGDGDGSHGGDSNGGSVSETPVPAAGFLLLAGLGAFAVAKRRKS